MRYFIAEHCPFCAEYGNIGFVQTGGEQRIVLVCDECGATWLDPEKTSPEFADAPQPPLFRITGTQSYLGKNSGWANLEAIESAGWGKYVAK